MGHRGKHFFLFLSTLLFSALSASGCGGGGGGNDLPGQPALVTQMQLKDSQLHVGDGTVLFTDIAYNTDDVFNFGNNVVLVVRLPSGVSYRNKTAELDGGKAGDTTLFPRVTQCLSGTSFLEFNLNADVLSLGVSPNGDSDSRVKLTIDGEAPIGNVEIEARASNNSLTFGCGDTFAPDQSVGLFLF